MSIDPLGTPLPSNETLGSRLSFAELSRSARTCAVMNSKAKKAGEDFAVRRGVEPDCAGRTYSPPKKEDKFRHVTHS
jgi:hypothetical protein